MLLDNFLYKNTCDGVYNSIDVHFTNICDNRCSFCIDKNSIIVNNGKPNWNAIYNRIIEHSDNIDDVLILGGEPCLFLDELYNLVTELKTNTTLSVYVTTSVPKTCYDNSDLFFKIIEKVDGINLSVQHHDEKAADNIRGTKSQYDRQSFYKSLPFKNKIRLNINLIKQFFNSKKTLISCLTHYDRMNFNAIKLSELQHSESNFISIDRFLNKSLKYSYSGGCQQYIDTLKYLGVGMRTPVLLKRSCFVCEKTLRASWLDTIKVFMKTLILKPRKRNYKYHVIYGDGQIHQSWIKLNKEPTQ